MIDASDFGRQMVRGPLKLCIVLSLTAALAGCFDSGSSDDKPQAVEPPAALPSQPAPVPELPPVSNQAPEITGVPDPSVVAGYDYNFSPEAKDADDDFLEFTIVNKPSWASFSTDTGALTGNPADTDVGDTSDITISVTDGRDQRSVGPFRIKVKPRHQVSPPSNRAPTIGGTPGASVDIGAAYSFQPVASDADGDRLTFSISNRPSWTTFSTASGTLSGTPKAANVGNYSKIVISVSDGKTSVALPAFAISVKGPDNNAPTVSGTPVTSVQVAQDYAFQPTAADADGDALTWSIQNKPSWATFSASSGRLSGTPASANVGNYSNIVVSVSDGKASVSLPAFGIAVLAAPNRAPTITGAPATVATTGVAYTFQPTAADADADTLGYSIKNKPSWATFSSSSGRLSGTPSAAGTHSNIVISVTDGKATASLPAFSIVVAAAAAARPVNNPPTLSGTPATSVTAGSSYTFQPTASDPEGAKLSWSIQNKPAWASFNTSTGRLTGTVTAGTFANVVISVSDGTTKVSLPAFTIKATSATLGSAEVSWVAPTENTDGSSITDLAGYRIVYGTSASALTQTIELSNPSLTTYVIEGLSSATWYFAVKAYNSAGAESTLSNVASKKIP
ncbi:MAG TPA: putative Ig domain-containing protein [Povalibacter sp.]|nr:putative Ig domain-containing protein [Povalibacter sp.]